ncbi:hypothetical protein [Streptomyces sp. NPDC088400]|uniref:hypothetical protein n=1 Tax=Streptomyces sp. NPDC088400 TaxID=3365861 RepID=UPI0037F744F2
MNRSAILIDIGGVLVPDHLTAAAAEWSTRLGISPHAFLAAAELRQAAVRTNRATIHNS